MEPDPIPSGYARAWLAMAQAEAVVERVEEELLRLRDLLKANPALLEFLKDPNIKPEGKRRALTELFQGRVHPLVLSLLMTLSDQERVGRLLPIIEQFRLLAAAARETLTGEVATAVPLEEATVSRLAAEVSRLTGKNVRLLPKLDPSVLGGAVITVGEQIIDGSLRRRLQQFKEQLAQ